ncbi:transposase domain-containing protein [Variovorax paradoxus]|uniref:transposase domain-containing protein n=1 Tax=Variovorax paradoxus TaxID=34073 RepID=UPI001F2752DC|nr:transposase domain-containing protein [Variovorax paradoxus]UKI08712.1 transposase domain-containing protein [Variovorax paradoxus]UKI11758.1 transposase domain-containing protein [Variovorax paradoxus]UKI11836.1 transposase domain-containing protein [Variovorax paradoxus]
MDVRGQRTGRPASGHRDEPGAVGAPERPRPWAYLRDVLQRLPTQRASQIEDLLPHRWQPACDAAP